MAKAMMFRPRVIDRDAQIETTQFSNMFFKPPNIIPPKSRGGRKAFRKSRQSRQSKSLDMDNEDFDETREPQPRTRNARRQMSMSSVMTSPSHSNNVDGVTKSQSYVNFPYNDANFDGLVKLDLSNEEVAFIRETGDPNPASFDGAGGSTARLLRYTPKTVRKLYTELSPKIPDDTRRDILIEQITQNLYECMVCYEKVLRSEPIWSCQKCFNIFHLKCIYEWAKTSVTENERNEEEDIPEKRWRCPGCQTYNENIPNSCRCFCGTLEFPESLEEAEDHQPPKIPHSCGLICSRIRPDSNCLHPCQILCHPGPCPSCLEPIRRPCGCGKSELAIICSSDLTICDSLCQKYLSCGIHRCVRPCHTGACGTCVLTVTLDCHCGKQSKVFQCRNTINISQTKYSCGFPCQKSPGNCCRKMCHPGPCRTAVKKRVVVPEFRPDSDPDEYNKGLCMFGLSFLALITSCVCLYILFTAFKTK